MEEALITLVSPHNLWSAKAWLILPSLNRRVNRGLNRGFGELKKNQKKKKLFLLQLEIAKRKKSNTYLVPS